jgi:hypothetical protein
MELYTLKEFLENVPPRKVVNIRDIPSQSSDSSATSVQVKLPELSLYCSSEECKGIRFFSHRNNITYYPDDDLYLYFARNNDSFLIYVCKNCEKEAKTYAILFSYNAIWSAVKYGEFPSFGPPTPARAIKLIGPDKELFLLGRRCENQGMGIGAFVYYRRVVENQKNRIFDEIIKVTKVVSPEDELLTELEAAKAETQFSKAVESIKHGIPQSLLINGQNPLLLLHSALSEGVHANDDAQCLELATSIRIVLIEFAERLGQALKDEAELTEAVKRLAGKRSKSS